MKSNGLWLTCGGHSLPSKGISWPLSGAASCYGGDAPGSTWLVFASRATSTSLLHSFRPDIRFADCRTSFERLLEIGDCRSSASFGATAPVRVNSPLRVPRQSMGVLRHVGLALHRFRLHLRDAGRAHRSPRGIFGELKEYCPQPPRQAPCDRHRGPSATPRSWTRRTRKVSFLWTSPRTSAQVQSCGKAKPAKTQVSISSQAFSATNVRPSPNSASISSSLVGDSCALWDHIAHISAY